MKQFFVSLVAAVVLSVGLLGAGFMNMESAQAQSKDDVCEGVGATTGGSGCATTGGVTVESMIKTGVRIFQMIIGIIALIFMCVGGLKFITSQGNPQEIASAKGTIIYAVVGIVVVALAEVIIQFALNRATTP